MLKLASLRIKRSTTGYSGEISMDNSLTEQQKSSSNRKNQIRVNELSKTHVIDLAALAPNQLIALEHAIDKEHAKRLQEYKAFNDDLYVEDPLI